MIINIERLYSLGIYACGTIRKGRVGMPKGVCKEKELARGEFKSRTNRQGLVTMLWKNNKAILFLSNFQHIDDVGSIGSKK